MWRHTNAGQREAPPNSPRLLGISGGAAPEPQGRRDRQLGYLPGLDGLRALAVIAVVVYHAGLPLRGGFVGVEVFFVLSGFLITALLGMEWQATSRVDLAAFWRRRARRLLPALGVLLAGTVLLQAFWLRSNMAPLGEDSAAALAYVMNWRLIWSEQSYFDPLVRPSLLQHLWSLAVEEQFYLVWPLLFVLGARVLRLSGLLVATVLGAVASAVWMAMLYQPGADPSRLYYGTDTRASGLLLGAAIALIWGRCTPATHGGGPLARLRDLVGVLGLIGLGAASVGLAETHPLLYRGGFLLVDLATIGVIVAVAAPDARLVPRLLGWAPLVWIGQRSYGLYLWHWPVFLVSRPHLDVPLDGWPLLLGRLLVVTGLAALSYRFVEQPIRQGALDRLWHTACTRRLLGSHGVTGRRRRWLPLAVVLTMVASIGTCTPHPSVAVTVAPARQPLPRAGIVAVPAVVPSGAPAPSSAAVASTVPPVPATTAVAAAATPAAATTSTDAEPNPAVPATPPGDQAAATPAPTSEPPALPGVDDGLAMELQRLLDETVAVNSIPGAVLAVGIPGYAPWSGASGVANRATAAPMEADTQIRLASTSKLFTAVVVLQLVDQGHVELDAPIATYLPDLLPAGDHITVRHLLNHTTGLYDFLEDRDLIAEAYRDPSYAWAPAELVGYAAQFPLRFRPGTPGAWDYSSTNYVVLGMLVEQRTGNTLAAEIRRRIIEPLGLTQTVFTPDEPVPGVLAHGYSDDVDLADVPMSVAFGTASIVSTAGDLERFATALFGGALLGPAIRAEMEHVVSGRGQYGMPDLAYGLGVMRNRLPLGPAADGHTRPATAGAVQGHIGGFGGFRSAVWHTDDGGITVALGMNQAAADPNELATRVLEAILAYQGR